MPSRLSNLRSRLAGPPALVALIAAGTLVASAEPSLPIYPGAAKLPIPAGYPIPNTCGSKTLLEMYQSPAGAQTVSRWYQAHTPGFVTVPSVAGETFRLAGDGSMGVKVTSSSVDPTSIAVIHYRPALGASWVAAVRDPKSAASTVTLKRMCSRG